MERLDGRRLRRRRFSFKVVIVNDKEAVATTIMISGTSCNRYVRGNGEVRAE
jgi:hypothetical protein